MRNIVTHSRAGLFAVPFLLFLFFSVCSVVILVRAGLWNGRGPSFGVVIPGALLLWCGYALRAELSAASRTTIETDSNERVLRIGSEKLLGPGRRVYPYDDICEVRVCGRKKGGCRANPAKTRCSSRLTRGWSAHRRAARAADRPPVAGRDGVAGGGRSRRRPQIEDFP